MFQTLITMTMLMALGLSVDIEWEVPTKNVPFEFNLKTNMLEIKSNANSKADPVALSFFDIEDRESGGITLYHADDPPTYLLKKCRTEKSNLFAELCPTIKKEYSYHWRMTKSEEAFKVECFTGEQEEEKKWRVVVDQERKDCDAENAESYWKLEVKTIKKTDGDGTERYRAMKKPEEKGDGDKTDGETEEEDEKKKDGEEEDGEEEDDRRKMSGAERDAVCLVTMFVAVAALWGF